MLHERPHGSEEVVRRGRGGGAGLDHSGDVLALQPGDGQPAICGADAADDPAIDGLGGRPEVVEGGAAEVGDAQRVHRPGGRLAGLARL